MHYSDLPFKKSDTILVTGGAGFIGSNLCEALLNIGVNVRCLDNLSTGTKKNVDMFVSNTNYSFIEGSIQNLDLCLSACESVDYVLHQAAWGSVPRSIKMPLRYEDINVKGTLNMLEASKQMKVKKFVYASSSSVYGDEPNLPKKEGKEGKILSPYAFTKKANEEWARLYSELYGLQTFGLRYFNVFGKRQTPDGAYAAVIPKFIKLILNDKQPIINGDGKHSRDFTYIENVIDANLKACFADEKFSGHSFNIAFGGREYIIDLVNTLCEILDKDIKPIFGPERSGDIMHSNADISKAVNCLGYSPKYNFSAGIKEAIAWYQSNIEIGGDL